MAEWDTEESSASSEILGSDVVLDETQTNEIAIGIFIADVEELSMENQDDQKADNMWSEPEVNSDSV